MPLLIPTMNDWFALARRYPDYMQVAHSLVQGGRNSTLKNYGYLACMNFIDETFAGRGKDVRLLEFGHGFSPEILVYTQHRHEAWGADFNQNLAYFSKFDWDKRIAEEVRPRCPEVRFVETLLNAETPSEILPDNSFDCIMSVSVLEEVSIEIVQDVLKGAARKLKPGGWLIGTHDIEFSNPGPRIAQYIEAHRAAGFDLGAVPANLNMDWRQTLLEHPFAVMLWYQQATPPEQRQYWGHFGTIWTAARKL